MTTSPIPPEWRVTEWSGSPTGPITFEVTSPRNLQFTVRTDDAVNFDVISSRGRVYDANDYFHITSTIQRYAFNQAFIHNRQTSTISRVSGVRVTSYYVDSDGDLTFTVYDGDEHVATAYLAREGSWSFYPVNGMPYAKAERAKVKAVCAQYIINRVTPTGM